MDTILGLLKNVMLVCNQLNNFSICFAQTAPKERKNSEKTQKK